LAKCIGVYAALCLEYGYLCDGWGAEDQIDSQHDHALVVGQHENSPIDSNLLARQAHTAHGHVRSSSIHAHIPDRFSLVPPMSPAQDYLSGIITILSLPQVQMSDTIVSPSSSPASLHSE
jgi:hypothetical protein